MTNRFDEGNIVEYLHNFKKEHIRRNQRYNDKIKKRNFSHDEIVEFLTEKEPLLIEQQESKKFALFYDYNNYNNNHIIKIIIVLKDKFINLPTAHPIKKDNFRNIKEVIENEKKILEVDYDYENDILFAFLDDEYYKDFEYSEFLDNSVSIDFDKKAIPIGVEISDASKKFKTEKQYLNDILSGALYISIHEEKIELNVNLFVIIHNKPTSLNPVDLIGDNVLNIPNIEASMVIA